MSAITTHSQPLFPASVSGGTALTAIDALHCSTLAPSMAAVTIAPAPYGIVALTRCILAVPALDGLLIVEGGSGGGWTDVGIHGLHGFGVTSGFEVGVQGTARWTTASNFTSNFSAGVALQATIHLDSTWTLALATDDVVKFSTWSGPPDRAIRVGAGWSGPCAVTADVRLQPHKGMSVLLAARMPLEEVCTFRASLSTEPLGVQAALRLAVPNVLPITLSLTSVLHTGFSASMIVEW